MSISPSPPIGLSESDILALVEAAGNKITKTYDSGNVYVCQMKGAKHRKKFKGQIIIGGKNTHIGTYDTVKEAAIAYDRAVLKANQCTSLLNFPDMVHNLDVEPKPLFF